MACMQIADHTPTLSFDFSGPLPIAVTGAKILMVFVWRLQDIRLLWAFALVRRTKENVLSCLQSVIVDLNTLTGGSKPPVTRVHSDQAKEFLSRPVMEWLKEKGIRQTFTSTYDSQANGVAERWINLIKTKSTALLASRYLPTPFWCYAVAWVTRCYNIKVLGQKPRKNLPEFGQLLLVRVHRENKLQERGSLGIMAGTCPEIANSVIVLSVHKNTVHESYTAHVAPATFSDKDRWFIKRDTKDPNKIVYVNDKGEIAWEAPLPHLPTVEQKLPLKYHPHYAALQRAVDGWAWYTSNVGQLLPHFEDIEPEDENEPLPARGGARFYTWDEISCEFLNTLAQEREEEKELPPLIQIVPEAGIELPPAPSGQPPKRKIEGSIALPQPLAEEVQRHAEEQDKFLTLLDDGDQRVQEELAQTLEEENTFPSSGGGVPSSVVDRSLDRVDRVDQSLDRVDRSLDRVSEESENDEHENRDSAGYSPENDDGASEIVAGPGCITQETRDEPVLSDREMDHPQTDKEDTISQPIPFQMGSTPQEEPQVEDELTDWYETSASGARGSTTPVAKAKSVGRRERSPRNLRNRQVARSIKSEQKVHWNLQAQKKEFDKTMTVEQMKMEWGLQETEYIQLNLDRQHAIMEQYPKWHTKWSLLNDPVGRGMSEVLTATIQNVRAQRKEMKKSRKVIPLDPFHMQSEYTVLSAKLTKLVDKQERSYQKVFLNSICGQGELLSSTNHILNTIEEMGQTHRQHRRKNLSVNKIVHDSSESVHPWFL